MSVLNPAVSTLPILSLPSAQLRPPLDYQASECYRAVK
jgi:hypothetical protein